MSRRVMLCHQYLPTRTHTRTHTHTNIYIYIYIYIHFKADGIAKRQIFLNASDYGVAAV